MFNAILDQLLIGCDSKLVYADRYKLCYIVHDLSIQINRDKDGTVTSANISPVERGNYDKHRKSTSSKAFHDTVYSRSARK